MQGGQFPAAAANSLIEGYCKDLIDAAAALTETLGQVNHRDIDIQDCHDPLQDVRQAMAELAGAFQGVLDSGCIRSQTLTGPTDDWAAPTSSDEPTEWPGTLQKLPSTPPPQSDGIGDNPWAGITQGHDETPSPDDAAAPTWAEDPLVAQLRGHDDTSRAADDHGDGDEDQPDDDTPMSGSLERTTTYTSPLYGSPEPVAADEGPIRKVFDILERSRKSGTLTVRLPDELLTFYFDSGCVQSCQTDNREKSDRLGDLLLDFESCDEQRITELIRRSEGSTHLQLGELIVREGLASNGQIMDALETQTRRRFHRACSAPQGAYRFVEGPPLRTDGRVRISPMELAFESSWSPGD